MSHDALESGRFEAEPCFDDVMHRPRARSLVLLKIVVALPVSRAFAVADFEVAKHDLRPLGTDHVPHRPHLRPTKLKADIGELNVGMQTLLHPAIVAPRETVKEALDDFFVSMHVGLQVLKLSSKHRRELFHL